jgi:RNA polymerase sigma factor (sigma-70 family)
MNMMKDDNKLLELIANKDANALEQLYDQYERPMYSFAFRMVRDQMIAEEVVQELFLRIWNNAERYDQRQGKLTTWMFTLTRNIAIDILRKKNRRAPEKLSEDDYILTLADHNSPKTEDAVEMKWMSDQVKKALLDLNQDQKHVMDLIYFQGFTQQEVSDQQSIPLGTVKSRVRLALKQLRNKLADLGRREYEHE